MDLNKLSDYILEASDYYIDLVLKRKQGNPTRDNVGGCGSQFTPGIKLQWSYPILLVQKPTIQLDHMFHFK